MILETREDATLIIDLIANCCTKVFKDKVAWTEEEKRQEMIRCWNHEVCKELRTRAQEMLNK